MPPLEYFLAEDPVCYSGDEQQLECVHASSSSKVIFSLWRPKEIMSLHKEVLPANEELLWIDGILLRFRLWSFLLGSTSHLLCNAVRIHLLVFKVMKHLIKYNYLIVLMIPGQ